MRPIRRDPAQPWHPAFWLASLGAGGLSISFFMYLMWMVPHPDHPMPVWSDLVLAVQGELPLAPGVHFVAVSATLFMVFLALLHLVLLVWNFREHQRAKPTEAYVKLKNSPAEIQFMAQPLTLAMTVNVCFACGALFVPGLWSVVEYLFPLALLAFGMLGVWSLRMYGRYLARYLVQGGFKPQEHNHLSGLMAVFTFSMLSVGFAAPAAMSHIKAVSAIAGTFSILFMVIAIIVAFLVLVSGAQAMMQFGLQSQATPSIWMMVPILTLLGIEWVRMQHGLAHHFQTPILSGVLFTTITAIFMLQLLILAIGYRVMILNGYLRAHLVGDQHSPVSFGLICPGVAIVVMGMFWWHLAWVNTGIVDPFGAVYWLGILVLALAQTATVLALLRLTSRLLRHKPAVIASAQ
ncbi:MAG: hypothetical protein GX049_09580 [Alcaligenaceae bacterium]|nr:hypothetical protein [Alcaligenaceae bacterium]